MSDIILYNNIEILKVWDGKTDLRQILIENRQDINKTLLELNMYPNLRLHPLFKIFAEKGCSCGMLSSELFLSTPEELDVVVERLVRNLNHIGYVNDDTFNYERMSGIFIDRRSIIYTYSSAISMLINSCGNTYIYENYILYPNDSLKVTTLHFFVLLYFIESDWYKNYRYTLFTAKNNTERFFIASGFFKNVLQLDVFGDYNLFNIDLRAKLLFDKYVELDTDGSDNNEVIFYESQLKVFVRFIEILSDEILKETSPYLETRVNNMKLTIVSTNFECSKWQTYILPFFNKIQKNNLVSEFYLKVISGAVLYLNLYDNEINIDLLKQFILLFKTNNMIKSRLIISFPLLSEGYIHEIVPFIENNMSMKLLDSRVNLLTYYGEKT